MRATACALVGALAATVVSSCTSISRSVTDATFSIREAPPDPSFSGLMVYSDLEGDHVPPRRAALAPGTHVVLSFVACERWSEEYGPPRWSCRADDAPPTPEVLHAVERAAACFDLERKEAPADILAALSRDGWEPPPTSQTRLVIVRKTMTNRNREIHALGCENAPPGQACDPIGAKDTGRTLEQVTRSREVLLVEPAPSSDPWLHGWLFPAWKAGVTSFPVQTPEGAFAPGASLDDAQARTWLSRLEALDLAAAPRTVRLSAHWDRAVLAFKLKDLERGRQALAAAERELDQGPSAEFLDAQLRGQAPTLHAILEGSLSFTDPCRRRR
jgi:hypothetical protein